MTGIFFGSTMGTTEAVAADIAKQLGVADADVHNVADTPAGEVQKYDLLVLGSSTWGAGYAAGDVRVKSLRQVVTAVADGAIAAVQVERSMSDY